MKRYFFATSFVFGLLLFLPLKSVYATFTTTAKASSNTFSTALVFPTITPSPTPTPNDEGGHDDDHDDNGHGKKCEIESEKYHDKDGDHFRFKIKNCKGHKKIKYHLEYDTDRVHEGVDGEDKFEDDNDFESHPIFLGSCSSDEVCVHDKNPRNFDLDVHIFKNDDDHEGERHSSHED